MITEGFFGECTAFGDGIEAGRGPGGGDEEGSFGISISDSFLISTVGDCFVFDTDGSLDVACPGLLKNEVIDF